MRFTRRFGFVLVTVALGLTLAAGFLYGPSLHAPRYGDDLAFVFDDPAENTLASFFEQNTEHFFRPLDYAYQAYVQTLVGQATWPIHLMGLGVHVLLALLVFAAARSVRMSFLQSALAALFMVVAQSATGAVLGNDTLSQVAGAFWGSLAIWLLYLSTYRAPRLPRLLYVLSLASLALALLSKETSASFVVIALGLLVVRAVPSTGTRSRVWTRPDAWRQVVTRGLPILVLFVGYLALRAHASRAEVVFGDDRYAFHLGLNIAKNVMQFGLAAVLPASNVTAFTAFHGGHWGHLAVLLLAALAATLAVGVGLYQARRGWLTAFLIGCSVLALFPVALMNHVSELYLYNALPFVSLLVGLGLGTLLSSVRSTPIRVALALGVAAFFIGHAAASRSKANLMQENGERAERILAELLPCMDDLPPDASVRLINSPAAQLTYSVYLLPEFNVFRIGEAPVARLAGRPDVTVRVVDPEGTFNTDLTRPPDSTASFTFSLPYGKPIASLCRKSLQPERESRSITG